MKVLLSSPLFAQRRAAPLEKLAMAGCQVMDFRDQTTVEKTDYDEALGKADAIILGNQPVVDQAFLSRAPNLKVIAKLGTGLDNVDLAAAARRGLMVLRTPGANAPAVADYTFALILNLARQIGSADIAIRSGRWEKRLGLEMGGRKIGLIGLGAIGRGVVKRAKGFDMLCAACDPDWPEDFAREQNLERLGMEELLETADVITLHCPLTPSTRHLIGSVELRKMKPTALLINTARGELVDEAALCEALSKGWLAGAALDVFEKEPLADSPLLALNNILLTPHQAWFTTESTARMEDDLVKQLLDYINNNL